MADKCNPCQCSELYYRNVTTWRKGVLKLLCTILEAIRNFPGGGGIDCVNTATVAEGVPVMCTSTGAAPLACGDLGDVLTVTGTDPCTAAWQPAGGAASAFQWSTSEQVWPFEKTVNGDTLYCKQIDMGTFNPSSLTVAHNIPNYDVEKMYKIEGWAANNNYLGLQVGFQLSWATTVAASAIQLQVLDGNITLQTGQDLTGTHAVVRIWYWK